MYFIGIDPGANGFVAVAYLPDEPSAHIELTQHTTIGKSGIGIKSALAEIRIKYPNIYDYSQNCRVFLEQVHARPTDGVKQAFEFGRNFGMCETVLENFGVWGVTDLVPPQKWQEYAHGGISRSQFPNPKQRSIAFLRRFWPMQKFTQENADAVCIALYGANRWLLTKGE